MPEDNAESLLATAADVEAPVRALVHVVDEALDAQRDLEQQLRHRLQINNTDFRALMVVQRRQRRALTTRPRDITHALGVSSGATAQIIGRLTRTALLIRSTAPDDARGGVLELSANASTQLDAATAGLRADLDRLVHDLTAPEEAQLIDLLDRARDIFHTHSDGGGPSADASE